jgi:hypothetical protein
MNKSEILKCQRCLEFVISNFEFVSDFDIRYSDFIIV